MATFNFTTSLGQTLTFNPAADILNIGYGAADVTLTQVGADTVITVAGVGSVTLAATTLGQLHTGTTNPNIGVSGGSIKIGDQTSSDALDALGQAGTTLDVTTGDAIIYGMGGADSSIDFTGTGNGVIFGGTGITDTTDGSDTIVASATGNVTVYGNAGNDTITGAATLSGKTHTLYAGLGNDQYTFGAAVAGSTTVADLGAGNDTVVTGAVLAGTFAITAGLGNDTVSTASVTGDVTVIGGAGLTDTADGADTITLGVHNAVVYGNAGADTIHYAGKTSGTTAINAGLGNDTIDDTGVAAIGAVTITGGLGSDSVTAVDAGITSLLIYGGAGLTDTADGADSITVGAAAIGAATETLAIYGNAGNDTITAATSGDAGVAATVHGGAGNDTISVTLTNTDTAAIDITAGDDTLTLITAAADDATFTVTGYSTSDTVTLNLNAATAAALAVGTGSNSTVLDAGADGAVVFAGYTGDLSLTMVGGTKLVVNTGAADTLTGGTTGNDQFVAGAAGDTFSFTGANFVGDTDKLVGGAGTDVLLFTTAASVGAADLTNVTSVEKVTFGDFANGIVLGTAATAAGIVTVDGSAAGAGNALTITDTGAVSTDTVVIGGGGNDSIVLNEATGNLSITGGAGTDTLTTNSGNDTIDGGTGVDTIIGGAGNDSILGGAGADTITGGAGADTITGGTEGDSFLYTAATEAGDTVATVDVFTDFNANEDTFSFTTTAGSGNASGFVNGTATNFDTGNTTLAAAATAFIASDAILQAAEGAGIFVYGGKTYLVLNDDADATFSQAAGDYIVDITGYTGTLGTPDILTV